MFVYLPYSTFCHLVEKCKNLYQSETQTALCHEQCFLRQQENPSTPSISDCHFQTMSRKKEKYWEFLVAEKQIYGQDDMVVLHSGNWTLI